MKQTKGDIQLAKQRSPGGPQQRRGKVTTATPCRTTRAAQVTRRRSEKTCSPRRPRLPPPPLTWGLRPRPCAQMPRSRTRTHHHSVPPCDTKDASPPGPSAQGIFQARIPEWVAISYSILLGPFRKSQKARGEEINN